jgi:hypothetical protein
MPCFGCRQGRGRAGRRGRGRLPGAHRRAPGAPGKPPGAPGDPGARGLLDELADEALLESAAAGTLTTETTCTDSTHQTHTQPCLPERACGLSSSWYAATDSHASGHKLHMTVVIARMYVSLHARLRRAGRGGQAAPGAELVGRRVRVHWPESRLLPVTGEAAPARGGQAAAPAPPPLEDAQQGRLAAAAAGQAPAEPTAGEAPHGAAPGEAPGERAPAERAAAATAAAAEAQGLALPAGAPAKQSPDQAVAPAPADEAVEQQAAAERAAAPQAAPDRAALCPAGATGEPHQAAGGPTAAAAAPDQAAAGRVAAAAAPDEPVAPSLEAAAGTAEEPGGGVSYDGVVTAFNAETVGPMPVAPCSPSQSRHVLDLLCMPSNGTWLPAHLCL